MAEFFVFVYGTLKKGEPNAATMMDGAGGRSRFVGEAETVRQFPLIISTQFNIPFLLKDPGSGKNVRGEIYAVDQQKLDLLDELENHPNFYVREVETVRLESGELQDVFIYFLPHWREELVAQGSEMLSVYSSTDETHKRVYVARYLRDQALEKAGHSLIAEVRQRTS